MPGLLTGRLQVFIAYLSTVQMPWGARDLDSAPP